VQKVYSMHWFSHRRSCAAEDRSLVPTKSHAVWHQRALPSPHHPRRPNNGFACCCMQHTAYSACVALPCIVNGWLSSFSFFVPDDLDLWPWHSNSGKFLFSAPNRQVKSFIILCLVIRKLLCRQTNKQTDTTENIHLATLVGDKKAPTVPGNEQEGNEKQQLLNENEQYE